VIRRAAWGLLAALLACAAPARAQTGLVPPDFRTNFAIPDAPAFELLAVEPGTILRPQTPRELVLALTKFQGAEGGFAVPGAIAIEFSPGLLIGGGAMTQERYRRERLLHATRLSLAALRAGTGEGPSRLAIGVRLSLADEAGYGTDRDFPPGLRVQPALDSVHAITIQARQRVIRASGLRPDQVEVAPLDPGEREAVEALARRIARIWADRYWNAGRLDLAFAARVRTADSLGHDPRVDALSAWGTLARPVRAWGQVLIGGRLGAARDSLAAPLRGEGSVSARFYAGANRAKAFLEGQGSWRRDEAPDWFLNGGCEFAVAEWFWLDFHVGIERLPGGRSRLSTGFKFKTAVPGT
jgi:hypothetical protein